MTRSPAGPGSHDLALLAEAAFARHGDYESLFFEGTWARSGDLFERSRRLAAGLVALGVAPGDRVAVLMSNGPDVGVVYTGLWRAGAAVTPVIFLIAPDELRRILADAEATAIVTSPEFLPSVRGAASEAPSLRWVIAAGAGESDPQDGARGPELVSLQALEAGEPGDVVPRADDDLAALMYTGGTTGRAKGVMLSHENLWFCGRSSMQSTFVPGVVRTLVPLPLSHAFGLITTIVGLHHPEPGQGILMRWFDPLQWLELAQGHRIQRSAMVPSMIQVLLSAPLEQFDLSSLRFVNCGAAPLSVEVLNAFERRVPGVRICEGYGCTESGAVVSVNPTQKRKTGSVGPPIPGYEVRIVDDQERELPVGEVGEVCCRSPGVMRGYWREPDLTARSLRDGWLHTGDVGRVDQDGYLWIVDRKKDLILRGGFNVFPRDVEDALLEHPAVESAGVIGRPDEAHGEEVVAFVSLRGGVEPRPTPEDLVAFARDRIGRHKYPREVRILPAIPLTAVGKVDRKALRARMRAE